MPFPDWQFGGWLQALPKPVAWGALGAVALLGFVFIVFSYSHTLRELSRPRRWLLTGFRALMLLAVLLCLANPARVDHSADKGADKRMLAVLIDRSGSMNARDNRSETRLGNSVRLWKQHEDEVKQGFDGVDYYRFSTKMEKAAGLDDALQAPDAGAETHLYQALDQMLDLAPGGIVCLTDGLDTTGRKVDDLVARAQRLGVPVYFVAGSNRTRPGDLLAIREITMPSQVLRHTQFQAGVALEIASPKEAEVPVELWNKDEKIASTKLKVHAGWSVLPWSVPVSSKEPGPMQLEFRVGEGAKMQVAAATTQVVSKTKLDVLYYQGALQWGYRYLLTALQTDPSFRMTAILNPALNIQLTSATPDGAAMNDLPENAAALKRFQIVVLANVFADQLSAKQQRALVDYVKQGGAVLFIAPDSAASARFAGTELEQMLPVVFAPPAPQAKEGQAEAAFQKQLAEMNGADNGMDTSFAEQMVDEQPPAPKLYPFTAPAGAAEKVSRLFESGSNAPQFSNFAKVYKVKPGAEVLAQHPSDGPQAGGRWVIVARQQFGEGSSAVMTTDLLWRWKMSLPSESHLVETFWQQFMMLLARTSTGQGLRLVKNDEPASAGRAVTVRVEAAEGSAAAPSVVAISPSGVKQTLPVVEAETPGAGSQVSFTPDAEGRWEVSANDSAGNFARITMPVAIKGTAVESTDIPADVEALRRMAEATGGGLIGNDPAAIRPRPAAAQASATKLPQPLWDTRWIIATLLGLYGVELVTRRLAKLL